MELVEKGNFSSTTLRRRKGRIHYNSHEPTSSTSSLDSQNQIPGDSASKVTTIGNSNANNSNSDGGKSPFRNASNRSNSSNGLAKRMHIVSKRAALASKRKLWDTNDAVDNAAQSAVDVWESSYHSCRSFLIQSYGSAKHIYTATKDGVQKVEHHLLVPVRDVIVLPAFAGVEHTVNHTVGFLQSEEARGMASNTFKLIKQTPFIGEQLLAPVILNTVRALQKTYNIIQYPIPSRRSVRYAVDGIMEGTKYLIATSWREIYFYTKLVDASITRTLSHTQWRVLGSGPYSSLNEEHKAEVINHLCERYFSTLSSIARYELSCHIKYQNLKLYQNLVVSGLLLERGEDLTKYDTWLLREPEYMNTKEDILLMATDTDNEKKKSGVSPLWFYLPKKNTGERLEGAVWNCLAKHDCADVENSFQLFLQRDHDDYDDDETSQDRQKNRMHDAAEDNHPSDDSIPTISNWYDAKESDVLIDQQRHAISFIPNSICKKVAENTYTEKDKLRIPFDFLMRPTLWRFYGDGNTVRRGVWFLDTQRHGLQPYSEESASIMEEAYLFLKWKKLEDDSADSAGEKERDNIDTVLLTVQVSSPDGDETQLVQFRSLTQITAIQKSIAGGLSLFKRRVYRGADTSEGHRDLENTSDFVDQHGTVLRDDPISKIAAPKTVVQSSQEKDCKIAQKNLNNADHLVLVVHGIGEMLRTTDLFGMPLPGLSTSLIDCCSSLRNNNSEVLDIYTQLSKEDQALESLFDSGASRVEFLPIEWHETFATSSRVLKEGDQTDTTLSDISLETIPRLRNFANDTMLDILFFMSPRHHNMLINIVSKELNSVVKRFQTLTGFDGKISILSHSLGSVIAWDILSHQISNSSETPLRNTNGDLDELIHPEPTSPEAATHYPQLNFEVVNNFMIGSPVSVFLMMRNEQLTQDYSLPGGTKVFNIFHPYDPVAYRIEPLIHKDNAKTEPQIITDWRGGFRVQYQTKFLWRRLLNETKKTQKNVVKAVEARIEGMGLLDEANDGAPLYEEDAQSVFSEESGICRVEVGHLCGGRRLDYMLQEKELENANEYISAFAAHSSYWGEKDLSLFVSQEIFGFGRAIPTEDTDSWAEVGSRTGP